VGVLKHTKRQKGATCPKKKAEGDEFRFTSHCKSNEEIEEKEKSGGETATWVVQCSVLLASGSGLRQQAQKLRIKKETRNNPLKNN